MTIDFERSRCIVDLFVEGSEVVGIEGALRRELLLDNEEELLQPGHAAHCAVPTLVRGVEEEHHQLLDSRLR